MNSRLKVAVVQDALPFLGGAERVLEAVLELFPGAPIYTLVHNPKAFKKSLIKDHEVHTSFINKLPWAGKIYRRYLPLFPLAIEQFDLRTYDVILSFSYAVAHGVLVRPEQVHINFTYTPLRHAWHQYHHFTADEQMKSALKSWPSKIILHYLRLWDMAAAQRVDNFVAISHWVAGLVWRAYRRSARVIYPPVNVLDFQPLIPRGDYYLTVSRLARHKRVDLIVEAFSQLGLPLIVVGEGSERQKLERLAASNVKFLGWQPDENVRELMGRGKALVHAAEEDFGIAIVEAQASGCPIIAYGQGGVLETVIENQTGMYFQEQSVKAITAAVENFEGRASKFDVRIMQQNAERFSKPRFQEEVLDLVGGGSEALQNRKIAYSHNVV